MLVAVLAINFMLIHAAPGDPASVIAGEMGGGDEAVMASIKPTDKPATSKAARRCINPPKPLRRAHPKPANAGSVMVKRRRNKGGAS